MDKSLKQLIVEFNANGFYYSDNSAYGLKFKPECAQFISNHEEICDKFKNIKLTKLDKSIKTIDGSEINYMSEVITDSGYKYQILF